MHAANPAKGLAKQPIYMRIGGFEWQYVCVFQPYDPVLNPQDNHNLLKMFGLSLLIFFL